MLSASPGERGGGNQQRRRWLAGGRVSRQADVAVTRARAKAHFEIELGANELMEGTDL